MGFVPALNLSPLLKKQLSELNNLLAVVSLRTKPHRGFRDSCIDVPHAKNLTTAFIVLRLINIDRINQYMYASKMVRLPGFRSGCKIQAYIEGVVDDDF
jgi:hypothetical protein